MPKELEFAYKTAQKFISDYTDKGMFAVDATCGNGQDTLFLADLVGESGKVLAIDIQQEAIDSTKKLIEENNINSETVLYLNKSHDQMKDFILENDLGNPKAIMFNLGYLPGSDKILRTESDSTLRAVEQAIELLDSKGIITIVFYPHDEGIKEWIKVRSLLEDLTGPLNSYIFKRLNRKDPPFLVIITKD